VKLWTHAGIEFYKNKLANEKKRKKSLQDEMNAAGYHAGVPSNHAALLREDHTRFIGIADEQIDGINNLLALVSPAPMPRQIARVRVGHTITLLLSRHDGTTEELRVVVGGEGEYIDEFSPPHYSCTAPLIRQFIQKEVGHTVTVTIDGKMVEAELLKIEYITWENGPSQPVLLAA
jgi:transcription elongation GreA/GreB family factor